MKEKAMMKHQDIGDTGVMSSTNKMWFYGLTQSATCYKGLHQQTICYSWKKNIQVLSLYDCTVILDSTQKVS